MEYGTFRGVDQGIAPPQRQCGVEQFDPGRALAAFQSLGPEVLQPLELTPVQAGVSTPQP